LGKDSTGEDNSAGKDNSTGDIEVKGEFSEVAIFVLSILALVLAFDPG
jgi:hypothetical protein